MQEPDSPRESVKEQALHGVLAPGTLLGNYELISVLGQGGFGITYLARDSRLGRKVAIKEYLPSSLAVRETDTVVVPRSTAMAEEFIWGRDRFIDEARTLGRLGGISSIVPVYDFLEAHGTAYMVMAFAEGETLSHRLKEGRRLSPGDVESMMHLLMDGLEQVHEAGFVHRDIKPDNIILDAQTRPTLIDFGASRAAVAGQTNAMTAIFTPGYAAAEQFSSGRQGPWTDIYGLAATLYLVISGRAPPSAIDRILDDEYVPLAELRPQGFSSALLAAIDKGMAVRGSARPQSIAAWRELLAEEAAAPDQTIILPRRQASPDQTVAMPSRRQGEASPPTNEEAPNPKKGLRRKLSVASAALVLVLGSVGYWLWAPGGLLHPGSQSQTPPSSGTSAAATTVSPSDITQAFDGKWAVHTICEAFRGTRDFEHAYEMTVTDGAIYAEDGIKGAVGSGILTGRVLPGGQLSANYSGRIGADQKFVVDAPAGAPVTFSLGGRIYDGRGMAKQNTLRPCSITFVEQ